jgi:hypothetical protein
MKVASHDAIFGDGYEQPVKKSQNLHECVYETY